MRKARPKKVVTYVRLNEVAIEQLDQLALKEETDRSAIIRRIVLNALRDKEENNEKRTSMAR